MSVFETKWEGWQRWLDFFRLPVTAPSPWDVQGEPEGWASWRIHSTMDLNDGTLPGGITKNMFFLLGH